ncbi:MAG: hypothetical protein K8J08_06475 [Thermoanaerobaculia bacterium]|nr:hypothetical protein [Thermoanaerobaculia bacterium]
MTKRYFSGATEAQAILEAATHFGVEPEAVAFEPVSRKGSLRARTRSIIAVDDEAPVKIAGPPEEPAAKPAESSRPAAVATEAEPEKAASVSAVPTRAVSDAGGSGVAEKSRSKAASGAPAPVESAKGPDAPKVAAVAEPREEVPVDPAKVEAAVLSALETLLDLADLDVDPTVTVGEGEPEVNVTGADREWLLDGEGDLLLALEHLTGRILFRAGCARDRVRVDSDGFRAGLDEALRERTRKALEESRSSGRPVTFEPLGPAERRVIHLAVEEDGGGRSRSEGSGFRRRVRIEAVSSDVEAVEADA